jgi:hypothetical protein
MFGVIDRNIKEARVRCVLNNRTKENLLPLMTNMYILNDINEVDDDIEDFSLKTRAYWDCFRSYKFLILMKRDLSLRG